MGSREWSLNEDKAGILHLRALQGSGQMSSSVDYDCR